MTAHFAPTLAPALPVTLDLDEAAAIGATCAQLRCQRMLGVSHVISQLLRLRQAGASIWLRNVNASLRRCLQLRHLGPLFHFVDSE